MFCFFANTFMGISDLMTNHQQGVCHTCGLAIYIKKYLLRQKEEL
jgi:hypothetical protein